MKLTKADILKGASQRHERHIEKLGGTVEARPLTEGEWSELEAMRSSGAKVTGSPRYTKTGDVDVSKLQEDLKVEIDSQKIQRLEFEAQAQAVAWGLSVGEDVWTVDDVKQLRPVGVMKEIAEFIYDISGVSKESSQQAKSFRKDEGGADDNPDAPGRDTVQ